MDSASYAIDNDNDFYLEHLPTLDGLLEVGLTVFVDKIFPKYHDMTLIQYAIAKRKPKTLSLMLNRLKKINENNEKNENNENNKISEKDIMYPKTSNTRGSLLNLAVEFGSKSNGYEDADNSCLNVIIDYFKDYIKKDIKCIEAPLVQSIRCKNDDAIKTLIGAEADFFYPLQNNDDNITDLSILSEMPIMVIFRLNNDIDQLTELFDGILKDQKEKILERAIYLLKVNNQKFSEYLGDINLNEVKLFLDKEKINIRDPLNIIGPSAPTPTPTPEPNQNTQKKTSSGERKCSVDPSHGGDIEFCHSCNKYYCQNCILDHKCE